MIKQFLSSFLLLSLLFGTFPSVAFAYEYESEDESDIENADEISEEAEDAIEELEKFDGDDDIIGPMATGCIGDAYMELGNQEEALEYYLEASEQSENSFTSPMYLMRAAWVYEGMGDWGKAIELYEKIKTEYKKSFEGSEINKYIARATAMKNSAQ